MFGIFCLLLCNFYQIRALQWKNNVCTLWWATFFPKRSIRSQFSISLKSMVCNYFMNFLSAVVSQLSNLRTIMKTIDMGTLWCANIFQWLERNGFSPLKCVVCNHFVAFFLLRCVKITEFASYNKKMEGSYTLVNEVFVAFLWSNSMSAQNFFYRLC